MKDNEKSIEYYNGIFDKYKKITPIDRWDDFPELMLGLGFCMDCEHSFEDFSKICGLKLKKPKNDRDEKRNILFLLEHAPRQIVGNYLFSHWRYWTHWSFSSPDKYELDFIYRVIDILEAKYN